MALTHLLLASFLAFSSLKLVSPIVVNQNSGEEKKEISRYFHENPYGPVWENEPKEEERNFHQDVLDLPYFQLEDIPTNVTAHLGEDVHLHCRVNELGDKTVSWVKRRGQSFELLTFGHLTYSSDDRFSLVFVEPNDWILAIRRSKAKDTGVYECQVSAHPPLARCTNLVILVPLVEVVDSEGLSIAERFYRLDSTIELTCRGTTSFPTTRIVWLHGTTPLNHDTTRGGISVKTEAVPGGMWSRLQLAGARKSDAGAYFCLLGEAKASVFVHVLSSEYADAMQYGVGFKKSSHFSVLIISFVIQKSLSR